MIAVLTGDIINSENHDASAWMDMLKQYLHTFGKASVDWEIYRGDEFQLRLATKDALRAAIGLKALLRTIRGLDARMAIGIGTETFIGDRVSDSNGTAYRFSGRTFNTLEQNKRNLAIALDDKKLEITLNLILKMASVFMDDWSQVSAEIVTMVLQNPDASQKELAEKLKIQQSAVSQRVKRARLELVFELLEYYENKLKEITL
ncbi:SatD family protein [Spongiimicrobium salis]|uniref:SatD family protein n=1 Tax=Spongiimicrobium salis TaxID=1667022 RepID=UPI00374DB84D